MNTVGLLDSLKTLGATVCLIDGRLRVEGPPGVITPGIRDALSERKTEIIRLLRAQGRDPKPAHGAPGPNPPEQWRGGLRIDEETADVFSRFAEHGTQPAWDDLIGAAHLERRRTWCEETLSAVYRGQMTLSILAGGHVAAFPRGLAS